MNDLLAAWLDVYAGPGHRIECDGVHTLTLGSQLLVNVVVEPGSTPSAVVFSTPGSLPDGPAFDEAASPDWVETSGSRWRISVDPHDGVVLLSLSVLMEPLDQVSFHDLLARYVMTHILWAALLKSPVADWPVPDAEDMTAVLPMTLALQRA